MDNRTVDTFDGPYFHVICNGGKIEKGICTRCNIDVKAAAQQPTVATLRDHRDCTPATCDFVSEAVQTMSAEHEQPQQAKEEAGTVTVSFSVTLPKTNTLESVAACFEAFVDHVKRSDGYPDRLLGDVPDVNTKWENPNV